MSYSLSQLDAIGDVDPVAEAAKAFMLSNAQAPERTAAQAGTAAVLGNAAPNTAQAAAPQGR